MEALREEDVVISPFAEEGVAVSRRGRRRGRGALWAGLAAAVALAAGLGGWLGYAHFTDPFRTLEHFPVGAYFSGYQALTGSRFRADLTVQNDLGWDPRAGRLMVFGVEGDARSLVVLVAADQAGTHFAKGQRYRAEVEVARDGLVIAKRCEKR